MFLFSSFLLFLPLAEFGCSSSDSLTCSSKEIQKFCCSQLFVIYGKNKTKMQRAQCPLYYDLRATDTSNQQIQSQGWAQGQKIGKLLVKYINKNLFNSSSNRQDGILCLSFPKLLQTQQIKRWCADAVGYGEISLHAESLTADLLVVNYSDLNLTAVWTKMDATCWFTTFMFSDCRKRNCSRGPSAWFRKLMCSERDRDQSSSVLKVASDRGSHCFFGQFSVFGFLFGA